MSWDLWAVGFDKQGNEIWRAEISEPGMSVQYINTWRSGNSCVLRGDIKTADKIIRSDGLVLKDRSGPVGIISDYRMGDPPAKGPGPKPEDTLVITYVNRSTPYVYVQHTTHYVNSDGNWTGAPGGAYLRLDPPDPGHYGSVSIPIPQLTADAAKNAKLHPERD